MAETFMSSRKPVWGRYFEDCLSSDIESLILYKGLQRKIFGHYRLLSKRFPFAIYYKIDDDGGVLIHRVLDCRSNPDTSG